MVEDNKSLNKLALKSGFWYVISSVLITASATLTTPIFTRLLTQAEYGKVANFNSWYTMIAAFCNLNLTFSVGRAKLDYPQQLDKFIGCMQLLALIPSSIISALIISFIKPISVFWGIPTIGVIFLTINLLSVPAIEFYLNGSRYMYRYKESIAISWFTTFGSIAISLLLILSINNNNDVNRIIGIVIPNLLISIYIWIKTIKKGYIIYNKEWWTYGLKLSLPLVVHTLSLNILSQSDRAFITNICGSQNTAVYSIAYSYGNLILVVTSAVANGWLPWFHDKYYQGKFEEIRKNTVKMVVLGAYVGLACIAFAPEAIMILGGKTYINAQYCVAPIALGIFCQFVYTHYVNIEMHLKKTKYVPIGTILAALINIILNAIFIPRFGYTGAAYTTFFSYLILMVVHFLITKRILHISVYNNMFMFCAVLMTTTIGLLLVFIYNYSIIRYCLTIIGFCSFVYYFRENIFSFIRNKLNKQENNMYT